MNKMKKYCVLVFFEMTIACDTKNKNKQTLVTIRVIIIFIGYNFYLYVYTYCLVTGVTRVFI